MLNVYVLSRRLLGNGSVSTIIESPYETRRSSRKKPLRQSSLWEELLKASRGDDEQLAEDDPTGVSTGGDDFTG